MVFETLGPTTALRESVDEKTNEVRLTGVFGVCGIKNENRRIYSKENYGLMVDALQGVIVNEGLLGELEHPNTMNINLNNVSHKIESIEMNEDGTITGTILLLDTNKGKDAQAIVKSGCPLYISSRGAGSIDESGHVTLSTIKTYDLVGTPGFSQAKLTLKPNQTLECLNEGLEDGNEVWAIVEGEDEDLLGDDNKDKDKKDDASSEPEKKEDEPKDDPEEKKDDEEDDKKEDETSDEDDNNNKNSNDTTMNDLKEAIDKLTEKVTSLEAELHVAQESLSTKDTEIATLKEEMSTFENPKYDKIQEWVVNEFAPDFKKEISEAVNAEVKTWTVEEFTDNIQNWLTEEFAPEIQTWVVEQFAPEVQNWVVEQFAPEVQNWVCEEFAPEVENWITEEFSPEVENWITEEFAPVVQNWVCEEYSPIVEGWVTEEFAPEYESKINENVAAFMESQKDAKINEIDALLESLSKSDAEGEAIKIMKEEKANSKFAGFYAIDNMPAEYQPSWNALSEAKQEEIARSSRMYDFTKQGILEKFWAEVDFAENKKPVNENANDITAPHYNNVVAQMMRLRRA